VPKTHRSFRGLVVAAAVGALVLTGIAASGCSTAASEKPATPVASNQAASKPSMPATVTTASDVQTCLECGTKKMPAMAKGTATVENGVQIVNIAIEGGTYVPNTIAVKAGMPVKVVFTGKAKGCLAKPTFKALDKKLDLTTAGSGTIDLGSVKAGTYKFTCGMGMNGGTITAS
jgi:plastocyanin